MTSSSRLISRRNQRFLLYEWLDCVTLTERARYAGQSREIYDEILELAERLATDLFAPHNRASDVHEPRIEAGRVVLARGVEEALEAYREAGLMGISLDQEVGGMQLPLVLSSAVAAWFHAANTATTGYALLTAAAANMLSTNASPEQVRRWVPPMAEGRFFGTMCLSEPQAGSSLADITTRAEAQEDGSYRIFGTKMWISGGEHELAENIVHLVLAKVPGGGPGVKGVGLFIVPRFLVGDDGSIGEENDIALAGLNHKMGYRGTVNTVLGFGEGAHEPEGSGGAVGYLVGEAHRGLAYMFRMMNEARIGVGLVATALGYTGYLKSLDYARQRPQGRPVQERDPGSPQVPIVEHADVRRMLLAQKAYAEGAMALVLYCSRLYDDAETLEDEDERQRARLLLEILTPIAKSWPSQWCLEANSLAVQVHGGYGYSREYDVEQHYRDNRLNPIHEGTHGIQAIDLLGRKVTMSDGAAFRALIAMLREGVRAAGREGGEAADMAAVLAQLVDRLESATARAWAAGTPEQVLANATPYLEATGHLVVGRMWLSQMVATLGKDDAFYEGKRQAARFFFRSELPRVEPMLDLVAALDPTALEMRDEWF
ncbi:MAG: acyl-CoA dehydrogenase [Solirubrobacterales bacterium]